MSSSTFRDAISSLTRRVHPLYLAASVFCVGIALWLVQGLAWYNDAWFLMSVGRDVIESGGAPHAALFSCFEGLKTVEQQWLYGLVLYEAYCLGGQGGAMVFCSAVCLADMLLAVALAARMSGNRRPSAIGVFLMAVMLVLMSTCGTMRCRPSIVTVLIWLVLAHVSMSAREKGDFRLLAVIPPLCLLHTCLHASMLMFDFAVLAAFLLPPSLGKGGKDNSDQWDASGFWHRARAFAVIFVSSLVLSLINPYGADGTFYFFLSHGAASAKVLGVTPISELRSLFEILSSGFTPFVIPIIFGFVVIGVSIAGIALALQNEQHVGPEFSIIILAVISAVMTVASIRCANMVYLFGGICIAACFPGSDVVAERNNDVIPVALMIVLAICLPLAELFGSYDDQFSHEADNCYEVSNAVSAIRSEVGSGADATVFADGNDAGILEFEGWRVETDARPELFAPAIAGTETDYNALWLEYSADMIRGDYDSARSFIELADCTYLIATRATTGGSANFDSACAFFESLGYERIDEGCGNGYALYGKKTRPIKGDIAG